jgi:hypothetical protein
VNETHKTAKLLVSLDRIDRPFVCTHTGTQYITQALLVAEGCACMRRYRHRTTLEKTELSSLQSQMLAQMHCVPLDNLRRYSERDITPKGPHIKVELESMSLSSHYTSEGKDKLQLG